MKKNFVKKLALGLALVMAVTSVPATSEAAAKPGFKSSKVTVKVGQTKKYNTANASKYSVKFKIGNKSVATIKYSAGSKAVKVTGVAEGKTTLRADFKSYKTKKTTTVKVPVTVKAEKTEVKTFAATASKTITLTGTALDKLTAANVTVAGYNVVDFTATKTTATITLDRMMVPNTAITVTVGEFTGTVQYNLTVSNLAVVAGTFDDDLDYQYVKFTVNGETIEAQDMLDNGYTVMFSAIDLNGTQPAPAPNFFADPLLGLIAVPAVEGKYSVNVTVSNGTTVVTSEYATIVIDDLHASVNSIDAYTLSNKGINGVGAMKLPQVSTTLVVGEEATFTAVKATVDGIKGNRVEGAATIKSSNPEVISVDNATKTIKAETMGTAVITISYGNVTKTLNFTVTNVARKLNTAKVYDDVTDAYISSKNYVASSGAAKEDTLLVVPFDQYGDPIVVNDIYAGSSNTKVVVEDGFAAWSAPITDVNGDGYYAVNLKVLAKANGRASIIIRDKVSVGITQQTNTKTLLTFAYNVSANDTITYKKLEAATGKYNVTVTDAAIKVVLKGYNSSNVFVENLALDGYTLTTTNNKVIAVGTTTGTTTTCAGKTADVYAVGAGTATVTLTNALGVKTSIVFTVSSTVPTITGVSFKPASVVTTQNKVFTFRDFLTTTEVGNNATSTDLIVSGISTNVASTSKIRIHSTDGVNGTLYLDRNDDGQLHNAQGNDAFKPADIELGYIVLSTTAGSTPELATLVTAAGSQGYVKAVVYADVANTITIATTTIKVAVPYVY